MTGIYKIALTNAQFGISKEVLATKILPFLMPLSIDNDLTLNQFNSLITLVKEMVNRVEREHRNKLEQLNSMQKEQRLVKTVSILVIIPNNKFSKSTNSIINLINCPCQKCPPANYRPLNIINILLKINVIFCYSLIKNFILLE